MIESPVVARHSGLYHIVSPSDFTLGPGRAIAALPADATPYCVDLENQCLLCVTAPGVLDHPFMYQAQRKHARTVIQIPFSDLPEETLTPALIFSPGRCGSTMLLLALKAIGLPSASEPDYFRQIGHSFARDKFRPREICQRLLRSATAILAGKLGGSSPVIKLHLQCNQAPLLITQAFASAKVIFILREHRDWALSTKRVAPAISARGAVGSLKRALWALNRLSEVHDVRICHYRDFSQSNPEYFRELASFLGRDTDVPVEALQAVLARDSQEGTHVARLKIGRDRVDPRFLEEFERLWEAEKPAALIERRGLSGLI